jgi:hypothetical protein
LPHCKAAGQISTLIIVQKTTLSSKITKRLY